MRTININDLEVGTVADENYYSSTGDLLISEGTTITETFKNLLEKKNHTSLFMKETVSEDEELQNLLTAKFNKMNDIDFGPAKEENIDLQGPAKALELPQFKDIKKGEEGLQQLNNSPQALALDEKIRRGDTPDAPVGTPLKEKSKEIMPDDRTEEYKIEVISNYDQALFTVKKILNSVANGESMDSIQIRTIVKGFINTFITDKNILLNLSNQRDKDDIYIYSHSLNVSLLAINIAASYGYSEEQVIAIGIGALFSDIGMLLIPKEIYNKKGRLNADEWFEVQKHPILGLHLLEHISRLPESVPLISYQSHERDNGSGYPKKRSSRFIHRFSQIVQIADIYIALCTDRAYRKGIPPYKAMEAIIKMTRHGLVSGEFVKALLTYTSLFPVGSLVELSDKRIGKVVKANGTSFAKPIVNILTDSDQVVLPKERFELFDLSDDTDISIAKALSLDHLKDVSTMDGF